MAYAEDGRRSQRAFDPGRTAQIADYMLENPDDYALGALTLAIDKEYMFEEVERGSNIGVVTIPYDARLGTIDGQHRRGGIKTAVEQIHEIAGQNTAILIYVEMDIEKRRQMFSDMNWHQKPVSWSLNVGFDQRDPFARVTQRLVTEHPLLRNRVDHERASVSASSPKLFALGAVYDALGRCYVGINGRLRNKSKWANEDAEIFRTGHDFFDLLVEARPEYAHIVDGSANPPTLRKKSILGSGTTLKVLGGVYHIAIMRRAYAPEDLIEPLSFINFNPKRKQWHKFGFVTPGKATPNARLQEVKAATDYIADRAAPARK